MQYGKLALVQTEHGEELLRVEVLHSPLGLEMVRLRIDIVVECRLRAKRINDPQQATTCITIHRVSQYTAYHNTPRITIHHVSQYNMYHSTSTTITQQ